MFFSSLSLSSHSSSLFYVDKVVLGQIILIWNKETKNPSVHTPLSCSDGGFFWIKVLIRWSILFFSTSIFILHKNNHQRDIIKTSCSHRYKLRQRESGYETRCISTSCSISASAADEARWCKSGEIGTKLTASWRGKITFNIFAFSCLILNFNHKVDLNHKFGFFLKSWSQS